LRRPTRPASPRIGWPLPNSIATNKSLPFTVLLWEIIRTSYLDSNRGRSERQAREHELVTPGPFVKLRSRFRTTSGFPTGVHVNIAPAVRGNDTFAPPFVISPQHKRFDPTEWYADSIVFFSPGIVVRARRGIFPRIPNPPRFNVRRINPNRFSAPVLAGMQDVKGANCFLGVDWFRHNPLNARSSTATAILGLPTPRRQASSYHRIAWQGVPSTLERRRSRHPHPEASQGGVREAEMSGQLAEQSNQVHLIVRDSGKVEAAMQGQGLGLTSMQERVRLVNGTISIQSKPMRGTSVHVCVPLKADLTQWAAG